MLSLCSKLDASVEESERNHRSRISPVHYKSLRRTPSRKEWTVQHWCTFRRRSPSIRLKHRGGFVRLCDGNVIYLCFYKEPVKGTKTLDAVSMSKCINTLVRYCSNFENTCRNIGPTSFSSLSLVSKKWMKSTASSSVGNMLPPRWSCTERSECRDVASDTGSIWKQLNQLDVLLWIWLFEV